MKIKIEIKCVVFYTSIQTYTVLVRRNLKNNSFKYVFCQTFSIHNEQKINFSYFTR